MKLLTRALLLPVVGALFLSACDSQESKVASLGQADGRGAQDTSVAGSGDGDEAGASQEPNPTQPADTDDTSSSDTHSDGATGGSNDTPDSGADQDAAAGDSDDTSASNPNGGADHNDSDDTTSSDPGGEADSSDEPSGDQSQEDTSAERALREVMWVGNNWDGTATIVDANRLRVLRTGVNLIPDKEQELNDIRTNPKDLAYYEAIKVGPGEGHDQYVDDMFTTLDGRYLAVSRPSFADVIWVDIDKITHGGGVDAIFREQDVDGQRTDHMARSPDGRRLLVSDSTANQVIEFSMVDETLDNGTEIKIGDRLRTFGSGDTPHESVFNPAGDTIYHASIGRVYTPGDYPTLGEPQQTAKGDRWYQIVRNDDFEILARWNMRNELAEAGHPNMSPAVRPMAVTEDERYIYYQVSFFHGLIEFDTTAPDINGTQDYMSGSIPEPDFGAVTRVVSLPDHAPATPREEYPNDSAHHGLSLSQSEDTLCVAGTIDDYAALVDRKTMQYDLFDASTTGHEYKKPYWTTEGLNDTCWISLSGSDSLAVLDTKRHEELAFLPVGNHPQRVRPGFVAESVIASW